MEKSRDILLQARNLERRDGRALRLRELDLELYRGETLGLLGVNGAGKSTTLALLSGALRPTSGRV
ncbi:MAG TPA: ATP-binding cassette domain-containing protein, partial [Chromatiaceae bacterium]|nr:ATP-binding cassette domain-containing protein [Chromatiaceae bacterium]